MSHTTTNENKEVIVHKVYEMGQAPYVFLGCWSAPAKILLERNPDLYKAEMKIKPKCCHFVCDHCGMCIEHHFIIQDANGEEFAVGSSCIEKIGKVERMTEAKNAERKRLNKQAKERNKLKREEKQAEKLRIIEEKEEQQRIQNNGLTNDELKFSLMETLKKQLAERKANIFEEIADELSLLRNSFATDLANQLEPLCSENGLKGTYISDFVNAPTPKQCYYIVELIAKGAGKKNCKAYKEKEEEVKQKLDIALEKFEQLKIEIEKEEMKIINQFK